MKKIFFVMLLSSFTQAHGAQIKANWQSEDANIESFLSEGQTVDLENNIPYNSIFMSTENITTRYLGWELPSNLQIDKYYDTAFPPNLYNFTATKYNKYIYTPLNDSKLIYTILFKSDFVYHSPKNESTVITNADIDEISNALTNFSVFDAKFKASSKKSTTNLTKTLIPNAYL